MDTLLRHWNMLRFIPRYPRKISVADIADQLEAAGYPTTKRTIQRDLDKLSLEFPLLTDGNKPSGWSWQAQAEIFDVPGMDTSAALTFSMVDTYMRRLLPKGCLSALTPHLKHANRLLEQLEGGALKQWPNKIRIVQRSQMLQPPTIAADVMSTVYEALFHDRQFVGQYKGRTEKSTREFVVNPLGLIFNDPVIYLVGTLWTYDDVKLLALHRFSDTRLLKDGCHRPADFCLDDYLNSGAVEFPVSNSTGTLQLVIRMQADVAHHLQESPMCPDQNITNDTEGWVKVSGTMADTQQLRWWLMGFGAKVEVVEPASLRDEFYETVKELSDIYVC